MAFEDAFHIEISPGPLTGNKAQTYEEEVRVVLSQVWTTDSGTALLTALSKTGFWTRVTPYDANRGPCEPQLNPVPSRKDGGRQFRSQVCFTASETCQHRFATSPAGYLHHELVHALRQTTNQWTPVPLGDDLEHYENYEELLAVVLTNVHISDESNRLKSKLRGSYKIRKELEPELAGSVTFFATSPLMFPLLSRFCGQQPEYTATLSEINAGFNPIAAIYQHDWAAELMSKSASVTAWQKPGIHRSTSGVEQDETGCPRRQCSGR